MANGTLGVAYSQTLATTGGDGSYTWAMSNSTTLPAGLSLNASTGEISGAPTAEGTTNFEVEVKSAGQTAQQALSITVSALPVLQPSELCTDNSDAAIATFEDANLEAGVRSALGVGTEADLTCGLISGLTDLDIQHEGIESLVGIQNLTSLVNLDLDENSITYVGELSGLTGLTVLGLVENSISNISALSGLTSLTELYLRDNSISDISALSGLTSLTILNLSDNSNLSNIQPLLDNTGRGAGDAVFLTSTSVSCTDVAALAAKAVTVTSSC